MTLEHLLPEDLPLPEGAERQSAGDASCGCRGFRQDSRSPRGAAVLPPGAVRLEPGREAQWGPRARRAPVIKLPREGAIGAVQVEDNQASVLAWARQLRANAAASRGREQSGPGQVPDSGRTWHREACGGRPLERDDFGESPATGGAGTGTGTVATAPNTDLGDLPSLAEQLYPDSPEEEVDKEEGGFLIKGYQCAGLQKLPALVDHLIPRWMMASTILGAPEGLREEVAVPNLVLSVVSPDGRLVLTRAYTQPAAFSSEEEVFVAAPTTRFRLGSVAKTLTGLAVARAAESGQLGSAGWLAPVGDFVSPSPEHYLNFSSDDAAAVQGLLDQLTVDDLLRHYSGWDPGQAVPHWDPEDSENQDLLVTPTKDNDKVAQWANKTLPVSHEDVLNYGLSMYFSGLGVAPEVDDEEVLRPAWVLPSGGRTQVYDNFNYFVLGRVLEAATGRSYFSALRTKVLGPLDKDGVALAGSALSERQDDEAPYVNNLRRRSSHTMCSEDPDYGQSQLSSRAEAAPFPPVGVDVLAGRACVYLPYGTRNLANADSAGWLIGSCLDLARFAREMNLPKDTAGIVTDPSLRYWLLKPLTTAEGRAVDDERACSWRVDGRGRYHTGTLPGGRALIVLGDLNRNPDGSAGPGGGLGLLPDQGWAFFLAFNTERTSDSSDDGFSDDPPDRFRSLESLRRNLTLGLDAMDDGAWGSCDGFDWYAEDVTLVDKGQGSSADNVPTDGGLEVGSKEVSLASG